MRDQHHHPYDKKNNSHNKQMMTRTTTPHTKNCQWRMVRQWRLLRILVVVVVVVATVILPPQPASAFLMIPLSLSLSSSSSGSRRMTTANDNNSNNEQPDLFDYFDPLLSPHAYPNGIQPNPQSPPTTTATKTKQEQPFGIDYMSQKKKKQQQQQQQNEEMVSSSSSSAADMDFSNGDSSSFTFDPRISPHEYPLGIDQGRRRLPANANDDDVDDDETTSAKSSTTTTIGILLMDHGSKNPNSNRRLQQVAELYKDYLLTLTNKNDNQVQYVVEYAHMEIATPSIVDGLQALLLLQSSPMPRMTQIICCPYFLSPGKHVTQDIPQLVQAAMDQLGWNKNKNNNNNDTDATKEEESSLWPTVQIAPPIGSQTDWMMGAIHASILSSSSTTTDDPTTTTTTTTPQSQDV